LAVPEEVETGDEIPKAEQTDPCRSSEINNGENTPCAVHEDRIFDLIEPMALVNDEVPCRIVLVDIVVIDDLSIRSSCFDVGTIFFIGFVLEDAPLLTGEQKLKEIT
jgi:hypothetical protein